jgi:chaperonin GroEL (HSP60 family)
MPKRIVNAKIACLDFSLQKTKMKLGVQVVITDPEKLDQIRQRYIGQFLAFKRGDNKLLLGWTS